MLIGYARTSTSDQVNGLAVQIEQLTNTGCDKMFSEQVSSVATIRPALNDLIEFAREGDTVCVTKPCRLARSVSDLLNIISRLEGKGVHLRILSMGGSEVDTSSPTGKLTLTMLGAVAEFERSLMLERQREGIQKAKENGAYKGRKPTAMNQATVVLQLMASGKSPTDIADHLRISRSSVYRILGTMR